jgi:hypothetical protein
VPHHALFLSASNAGHFFKNLQQIVASSTLRRSYPSMAGLAQVALRLTLRPIKNAQSNGLQLFPLRSNTEPTGRIKNISAKI